MEVVSNMLCRTCKITKPINDFSKDITTKLGYKSQCNECRKQYRNQPDVKAKEKASYKEYYHRPEIKAKYEEYRNSNKVKERIQLWTNNVEVKQKIKESLEKRKPDRNKRMRERYQTDENYRLIAILRSKIHKMLNGVKTSYTNILSCDLNFLKTWIEFRFDDNMNWDNLGEYWEIDHILPIAKFNFANELDKNICFHWTNLQPLIKLENRCKSKKIQLHYFFNNIVNVNRFNNKYNQFLGYQALNESLKWLKNNEFRYGNNPSYDSDVKSDEIGNPHPSS